MEDFWKEAEMEIDQMSKPQKVVWLVVITIVALGLLSSAGALILQLVGQTIDLMKGKI